MLKLDNLHNYDSVCEDKCEDKCEVGFMAKVGSVFIKRLQTFILNLFHVCDVFNVFYFYLNGYYIRLSVCYREGSVIVTLESDFLTNATDEFINSILPTILQNMMTNNNSFTLDGVNYPTAVDSVVGSDNATTCMCHSQQCHSFN